MLNLMLTQPVLHCHFEVTWCSYVLRSLSETRLLVQRLMHLASFTTSLVLLLVLLLGPMAG